MGVVAKVGTVPMVLYTIKVVSTRVVLIVLYELEAARNVVGGATEGSEGVGVEYSDSGTVTIARAVVASFELADDAACLLYFAAWCTIPLLLDSIFVPFSRAISSNAMQAKSAQRIVKRKGDLVANGV